MLFICDCIFLYLIFKTNALTTQDSGSSAFSSYRETMDIIEIPPGKVYRLSQPRVVIDGGQAEFYENYVVLNEIKPVR